MTASLISGPLKKLFAQIAKNSAKMELAASFVSADISLTTASNITELTETYVSSLVNNTDMQREISTQFG